MARKHSSSSRTHVVKREAGWAVRKEGAQRASRVYKTKEQAVKGGTEQSRNSGGDLVIHKKDGSIEKWVKAKQ